MQPIQPVQLAEPMSGATAPTKIKKGFLEQPDGFGGEEADGTDPDRTIEVTPYELFCIRARELLMEETEDEHGAAALFAIKVSRELGVIVIMLVIAMTLIMIAIKVSRGRGLRAAGSSRSSPGALDTP